MTSTESERERLHECLDEVLLELIDERHVADDDLLAFERTVRDAPDLDYVLTWWGTPFRAIAVLKLLERYCSDKEPEVRHLNAEEATALFRQGYGDVPGALFTSDLVISGDLQLVCPSTVFVLGSVEVEGHFFDEEVTQLFVNGDFKAKSVATEGDLVVLGDLTVDTLVHAFHNDGTLAVYGTTHAPLVVSEDHECYVSCDGRVVRTSDGDVEAELRAVVRDAFISSSGTVDVGNVATAFRSGVDVLRAPGAPPWQHPRGIPPNMETVGERLVRACMVGSTLFICSSGEHGNASQGRLWRRDDAGSWTESKKEGPSFGALLVHSSGDLLIAGVGGRVQRSSDRGDHWTELQTDVDASLNAMAEKADGTLFVGGDAGTVLRLRDNGASWTPCAPQVATVLGSRPLQAEVMDICVVPSGAVFVCTRQGHILRSDDGGVSWLTLSSGVSTPLCRMTPSGDSGLVVVGDGGVVLTTTDGESFQQQQSGTTADIEDIVRGDDGRLHAVSGAGELLSSVDGCCWDRRPSGSKQHLFGLCEAPNGSLVCVGADGTFVEAMPPIKPA